MFVYVQMPPMATAYAVSLQVASRATPLNRLLSDRPRPVCDRPRPAWR